jgi:hypothetical protein
MKHFEWLSEKEAESLTLSQYVAAARRTLEEAHARRLHLESNPPTSDLLRLIPADCRLLRGMNIKIEDEGTASRDSDSAI